MGGSSNQCPPPALHDNRDEVCGSADQHLTVEEQSEEEDVCMERGADPGEDSGGASQGLHLGLECDKAAIIQ